MLESSADVPKTAQRKSRWLNEVHDNPNTQIKLLCSEKPFPKKKQKQKPPKISQCWHS
uniref:Uncharacterized protein n=1 Tax=Anguilla anguilla TaxID=7936 RepID=A0A0E9WUJ5_ANGAN